MKEVRLLLPAKGIIVEEESYLWLFSIGDNGRVAQGLTDSLKAIQKRKKKRRDWMFSFYVKS